ncbi:MULTISPECIES: nuclear transport factor 2 family protein [unclassified Frankia]|uniref:nuclear transport factor 2 family protein n=1 Tax=unclassified Frankia TaxID=2632575 RepID=UPI001F32EB38|nr:MULTISPECIES: nuclear transport factor 2 family protein [unclassified Frankia]
MGLTSPTPAPGRFTGRSAGPIADRLALRDLAESYAAAVDARDTDLFVALFTADGALTVRQGTPDADPYATFAGAERLPAVVRALAARFTTTFHVVGNHRAQVSATADVATAEVYCVAHHLYREADGTPTDLRMLVRYADHCVRGDDGLWRFAHRAATALWQSTHPVTGSLLDHEAAAVAEPAESADPG